MLEEHLSVPPPGAALETRGGWARGVWPGESHDRSARLCGVEHLPCSVLLLLMRLGAVLFCSTDFDLEQFHGFSKKVFFFF